MFRIDRCDPAFEALLDTLLPRFIGDTVTQEPFGVSVESDWNVREVLDCILKTHSDCLWIRSACLIAPDGRTVLIAGRSGSGKSTTACGLALGYGWKVVSEDVVLIDFGQRKIIPFASPFSLKWDTMQLVRDALGSLPDVNLQGEWLPMTGELIATEIDARFDISILLDFVYPHTVELQFSELNSSELLRKLLPLSNALQIPESCEKLMALLDGGSCFCIHGGTPQHRFEKMLQLVEPL
ncbi:MAG: hypothetical protein ACRD3W_28960 [Terriglobales bacterium]